MKKAEIALRLCLRELQDHIIKAEGECLKAEERDDGTYVRAVEVDAAYGIAQECILDAARLMGINLTTEDYLFWLPGKRP